MIIDSNIIIYSVMPEFNVVRSFLKEHESELAVSAVSKIEVLGYHKLSAEDRLLFTGFFSSIRIIQIDNNIVDIATDIRQVKKTSLGDSIIAATALYTGKKLFTNNVSDFTGITGLNIIDMNTVL
jgi:predicted nucleic acid-binding protein